MHIIIDASLTLIALILYKGFRLTFSLISKAFIKSKSICCIAPPRQDVVLFKFHVRCYCLGFKIL